MKRKTKNIIMISLFILLVGLIVLTIKYAQKSISIEEKYNEYIETKDINDAEKKDKYMENESTQTINPSPQSDKEYNAKRSLVSFLKKDNKKTIVTKITTTMPENNLKKTKEVPSLSEKNSKENAPAPNIPDENSKENAPVPNITDENSKENKVDPAAIDNNRNNEVIDLNNITKELPLIYYILFLLEFLSLSLVVIYLVISKFNKLTLKEVFKSRKIYIIYFISSILSSIFLSILII